MRTLVLGGARSGKSSHAEKLVATADPGRGVHYVATSKADPDDADWAERIARHRARRPSSWSTVETTDLVSVLGRNDDAVVLVDCLGVWLTRMMDECDVWNEAPDVALASRSALEERVTELVTAVSTTRREVLLVSNEVGQGVVPAHWSGRFFRDQLGVLNMRIAAKCERVVFCVAGLPMELKG